MIPTFCCGRHQHELGASYRAQCGEDLLLLLVAQRPPTGAVQVSRWAFACPEIEAVDAWIGHKRIRLRLQILSKSAVHRDSFQIHVNKAGARQPEGRQIGVLAPHTRQLAPDIGEKI